MAVVVVLRTEDEPPADRLECWRAAVSDYLVPYDMSADTQADYRGTLVQSDLGAARFAELTAAPLLLRRTPKLIRRCDTELYLIEMHTRGSSILLRDERETVLGAGEVTIVDTSRPYRMAAGYPALPAGSHTGVPQLLTLMIPHAMLPLSADTVSTATGIGRCGLTVTSGLAATAMAQLARCAVAGEERTAARLARVLAELLAVGLADQVEKATLLPPEIQEHALMWRIQAFIENHLGDVELSPATVASAHHISLRYLHRLFECQGTTVAGRIRTRRLEQCRIQLADPAFRDRPVGAVAARWGFASPAHFSRLFRTTYGLPPAAWRDLHMR